MNVYHPTSSSVQNEIIAAPASPLADQPPVLAHPHSSDGLSSSHLDMDSVQSRPFDSNVSAWTSQPKAPMVSSSGPDKHPSSIHSRLSLNSGSRMESVSTQAPVSMSSTGSFTSPGKTSFPHYSYRLEKFHEHLHSQGKTDSEIYANPDHLLMKVEEQWQPQAVLSDCSHVDTSPSSEQKYDYQKPEKTHEEHAIESEQECLISYCEFENRDKVMAGVQHIQDDGKQLPMHTTNKVSHLLY